MKVFWFLCLTLFTLVAAQKDHVAVVRSAINLAQISGSTTSFHKEFAATVTNGSYVGRDCQNYIYNVNQVQSPSDNEASYYGITINVSPTGGSEGIFLTLSDADPENVYDIQYDSGTGSSFVGSVGTCSTGSCTFYYYCDTYPKVNALIITISTPCNDVTSITPPSSFTLTFTQYIETVQTIGASRTLTDTSSTLTGYSTSNPGPKNFAQFFHQIDPTVSESNAVFNLFAEFNFTSAGTWIICYSKSNIVNSFEATVALDTTITGEDVDGYGCNTVCRYISSSSSTATIQITSDGSCDLGCDDTNLWLGISPANGAITATFTVRLYFAAASPNAALPTVTQLTSTFFETEGFLAHDCDEADGDFTCTDFYSFSLASLGISYSNVTNATEQIFPFVRISLFGVLNGKVFLTVQANVLGGTDEFDCECDTVFDCVSGTDYYWDEGDHECSVLLNPCVWAADNTTEYVISIYTDDPSGYLDTTYPTSYGLRLEAGSFPVENVPLSYWITPSRNSIAIDAIHYYTVAVTDSNVSPDSIFTALLFSDLAEENIVFFWTRELSCPYKNINECHVSTDNDDVDSCTFVFTPCVHGYNDGVWEVGTYYFGVYLYSGEYSYFDGNEEYSNFYNAFQREVEYTINWKLENAAPVYEGITNIHNEFTYLSAQRYIDVPEDDTISRVRIIVSNVQGGDLETYFNIDDYAGTCGDCFDYIGYCETYSFEGYSHDNEESESKISKLLDCEFRLTGCQVRGKRIYFASYGYSDLDFDDSAYSTKPVGYTLTVHFDKLTSEPQLIEASRAGAQITSSISHAKNYYYYLYEGLEEFDNTRFFKVDFTNAALTNNDALRFTLSITSLYQEQYKHQLSEEGSLKFPSAMGLTVADNGYFVLDDVRSSIAVNENYNYNYKYTIPACSNTWNCVAYTNTLNYQTESVIESESVGYEGLFSSCYIVIQACEEVSCNERNGLSSIYYISVRNFPDNVYEEEGKKRNNNHQKLDKTNDVDFNINVQVISQNPVSLTNNIPLTGRLDPHSYAHFKYVISTPVANSWFTAKFYSNTDESVFTESEEEFVPHIKYYFHYVSATDEIIQAGSSDDCYLHDFCSVCATDFWNPECYYQVSPCEFKQSAGGTIYLSAFAYHTNFYHDGADFTIVAYTENIKELLVTNYPPVSSYVFDNTAEYYSLSIPSLPTGVAGWVLSVRLEAVQHGDAVITLGEISPDQNCECSQIGLTVDRGDNFFARYFPCEISPSQVLYLTVEGSQYDDEDPVSYTVHAHLDPVILRNIVLNDNSTTAISQSYDTTSVILGWDQYIAYSFSVNGGAGKLLAVTVTSSNAADTFSVHLSKGSISTTPGDFGGPFIYSPSDANCSTSIATCLYNNDDCDLFADDCMIADSGTETWYLTFDGRTLQPLHGSGNISFSIRVINPTTFNLPTTSGSTTTTTFISTSGVDGAFGHTNYVSSTAVGLTDGYSLTFSATGIFFEGLAFNEESGCDQGYCTGDNGCTLYACSTVSAGTWRFSSSGPGSLSITLDNTIFGNITATTIPINTVYTVPNIPANNWNYYSISAPAQSAGEFTLTTSIPTANFLFVDTPFNFPFFPSNSPKLATGLTSNGIVATCGTTFTEPFSAKCCYDAIDYTFAISPTSGGTINFKTTNYIDSTATIITSSSNLTTQAIAPQKVDIIPFRLDSSSNIWIEIGSNTTTALKVYINKGSNAGNPGSSSSDQCWNNIVDQSDLDCGSGVTSAATCKVYIDVCQPCFARDSTQDYYLSIYNPDTTAFGGYYVALEYDASAEAVAIGTNALTFPGNINIVDSNSDVSKLLPYTHFTFDYTTLITDSTVNFVPFESDLTAGTYNFPSILFSLSNIRISGTTTVLTTQVLDLYVSQLSCITFPSSAKVPASSLCQGGSYASGVYNCPISVCDLACTPVYWSVTRDSSAPTTDQYDFSFTATTQYNGINLVTPSIQIIDVNLGTSGTNTLAFTAATGPIYYRIKLGENYNLAGDTKNFPDLTFTYFSTSSATLSVEEYSSTCTTVESASTTVTSGTPYTFTTQPTDFEDIYGNSVDTVFYYRAKTTSTNFNITLSWVVTPVSVIPVSVSPENDYFATKEISNFEWHFYEFSVPLNGYYTLTISFNNFCCRADSSTLNIYSGFDNGAGDGIIDVARLNRYPDLIHNAKTGTLTSSNTITFNIPLTCDNYGGIYKISVYADKGTQFSSSFPAIYDVHASLYEVFHQKLDLYCFIGTYSLQHFVIEPEANNRGSQLVVYAYGASYLAVSSNGRPFDSERCIWYDDEDFTGIDYVEISYCDYTHDKWFVYVEYSGSLTIGTYFVRQYIPTVTPSPVYTTTAVSHEATIQYYKAIVPFSKFSGFRAEILSCDTDANLRLSVSEGNVGFSSSGGTWDSTPCEDDSNNCADIYCTTDDGECSIVLNEECGVDKVYFVGVENFDNDDAAYTLTLTADFQDELLPVYLDVPNCFAITCFSYFQVLNADGSPIALTPNSQFDISILSTSDDVDYIVSYSTSSIPNDNCYEGLRLFCNSDTDPCSASEQCATGNDLFIFITMDSNCGDCDDLIVSISVSFTTLIITPLTIGTISNSPYSSYTISNTSTQTVVVSPFVNPVYIQSVCGGQKECNILQPDPTATITYIFTGTSSVGVTLSTPTVIELSTTPTTQIYDPSVGFLHFSYTPSSTTRLESIVITNINYCVLDLDDSELNFSLYQSEISAPYSECNSCGTNADFTFQFDTCGTAFDSYFPTDDCYYGNYYFSICSSLTTFSCPVSFQVSVTETLISAIGSTHEESNFIHIADSTDSTLCSEPSLTYTYYTNNFLFAAVREAVGADVELSVCEFDSCDAYGTGTDDNYSACGISGECFTSYPNNFVITATVTPDDDYEGFSFDLLVVNQYLALSTPVQTTIGALTHYYSYSVATIQSIVFHLTVVDGPALNFFVFGASNSADQNYYGNAFSEGVSCAFGDCYVYVPSQAKRSNDVTFYITLTSSTLAGNPVASVFLDRNQAANSNKETSYDLSVTVGAQNCIAAATIASSAPFCSDVLKGVSNSVWSFADVVSKDSEAECLFNSIVDGLWCPQASNDCLDWVKTLSCLITFPQCDSNGFQSGVCRSVCGLVDQYCGATWPGQSDFYEYACDTDFYVDSNTSTCASLPSPPPPPSSVEDYKPVSAGPAVLAPFDVPVFSDVTIYLTTGEFASTGIFGTSGSTVTASELTSLFTPGAFVNSAPVIGFGVVAFLILVVL